MATIEELERIVAEIGVAMREGAEAAAESRRETDRAIKAMAEAAAEAAAESRKELELTMEKSRREVDASIDKLSKTVDRWAGRFGNTTGYITEMILVPGIRKKMDSHGHRFESLSARREFYRRDGSVFTEVDVLLENDKEVMIVEIKTHLTTDNVEYQVKRLNRLRKGETEAKITGRSLIAAVAGLSIDEDAREMAKELGMYVIQITENDSSITVEAPDKGVGRW